MSISMSRDSFKSVYFLSLFLLLLVASSCKPDPNKQIDEGKIADNIYKSEEIGWTMIIPDNWSITKRSEIERRNEKGKELLNEAIGEEYDFSQLKHLLHFQKNIFNSFQSSSEPFELEYEGEWEENNTGLKVLMIEAFEGRGIRVDSTSTKITKIDGLDFQTYKLTIYGPKGDVILNQILYSRLINGFDFGVNINYNNDKYKEEMLRAWLNSKFKK